nr:hypothetical protein [Tanacetum cinerariifolium]
TNQASEIEKLKKRVKKLKGKKKKRTNGLKRLYKVRLSARVESFKDEEDHGRIKDQDLFGVHDLDGDEVFVDVTTGENVEQDAIVVESVEDQITLDEKVARKLEAEMKAEIDEEERIAMEKNEANRAIIEEWDDVQAIIDVDSQEGKKSYFKIIKVNGNSQNYLTFGSMFKNFNKEDLEVLRSIVKERFKKTKLVYDMDNLLFLTLKTMFEHHVEDIIWKYQQGAVKVNNWKLFDSCRVYCVTTKNMEYYLLVKKMYPFTNSILHQLWTDVRLKVDYEVEMAYDLLRLIKRQINEGYKHE